jgi:histidinol-phosphate aminotransferase
MKGAIITLLAPALGTELGFSVLPSHTNFVSFDIGDCARVKALILALEKEGGFVRTGPPPNDGLQRVTVGTQEQRALFAAALKSVSAEA